jgi:hypothetical protein
MQGRYQAAMTRKEKGRLLTEVSENLNCHRKHSTRLLNGKIVDLKKPWRHREHVYPERLIRILESVWEASQQPCGVRLKEALPLWMPWIRMRWVSDRQEEKLLLRMSAATIDRRLAAYKHNRSRKIYGKTKPGRWLRQTIPIQTESWEVPGPGWLETDTVSHSGPSAAGLFAYTLTETDLFSAWVECRAILGKASAEVVPALEEIREAAPFDTKGLDSDNGEEFINFHVDRYCRSKGIQRFRSRPYKKDDQAHIEQKNWTHVRKLIGYGRYDTQQAVDALNDLYRNEWRLFCNMYLPSVKLEKKIRIGARIKRIYGPAKTPLDRLWESDQGDRVKLEKLRRLRETLDPFELSAAVDRKLAVIWKLASRARLQLVAPPPHRKKFWEQPDYGYNFPSPILLPIRNVDRILERLSMEDRFNIN